VAEKHKKQHGEPFGKHKDARASEQEEEVNQKQDQQTPADIQTAPGVTPAAGVTPLALAPPPAGALIRRVARITPSFGTPRQNDAQLYAGALTSAPIAVGSVTLPPQTAPLPPSGYILFTPTIAAGYIRVKVYNTTTAVTAVNVTMYDGQTGVATGNSETIAAWSGSLTALSATTGSVNILFEFQSDLNVSSMTVAVVGGTGGNMDVDLGVTSGSA
jgi:hypothetical protein